MEIVSCKKNETGINNKTKRETLIALISQVRCREDAPENRVCPPLYSMENIDYYENTCYYFYGSTQEEALYWAVYYVMLSILEEEVYSDFMTGFPVFYCVVEDEAKANASPPASFVNTLPCTYSECYP